jgi:hypothetical protein
MLAKTHLGEKHPDGLVRLGPRRLLTISPAQDPMLHRLWAATGDLGEIDHRLHLTVVVDVEEVDGAAMLDLLAVSARRDASDVIDQSAHVRGLALGRRGLRRADLLDDHDVPSSPSVSRTIAARRAVRAAAVSLLEAPPLSTRTFLRRPPSRRSSRIVVASVRDTTGRSRARARTDSATLRLQLKKTKLVS